MKTMDPIIQSALTAKRHFIIYIQDSGQLIIGTDDLADIARQEWFRQMMSNNTAHLYNQPEPAPVRYAAPAPQPVQQRPVQQSMPEQRPVQQPPPPPSPPREQALPESFMDVPPNAMRQDMWQAMSAEQQHVWAQKYGIQLN